MEPTATNQSIQKLITLPKSKVEIGAFADQVKEALTNGEVNPLEVLRFFKSMEKTYEAVKPVLDLNAVKEAEKFPARQPIEMSGVKFELAEFGTRYDYGACNDPEYDLLKSELDILTEKVKAREKFLQALKESIELVDEGTGEVTKISPPVKKSTTGLRTTFI